MKTFKQYINEGFVRSLARFIFKDVDRSKPNEKVRATKTQKVTKTQEKKVPIVKGKRYRGTENYPNAFQKRMTHEINKPHNYTGPDPHDPEHKMLKYKPDWKYYKRDKKTGKENWAKTYYANLGSKKIPFE